MRLAIFRCPKCGSGYEGVLLPAEITAPCPLCDQNNTPKTTWGPLDGLCRSCREPIDEHAGAFSLYCVKEKTK